MPRLETGYRSILSIVRQASAAIVLLAVLSAPSTPTLAQPVPEAELEQSTPATTPAPAAPSVGSGVEASDSGAPPAGAPAEDAGSADVDAPASAPASGDDPAAGASTVAGESTLPHDLSSWGMFMAADIVVKAVMIGLAFASLLTWTVWIAKSLQLAAAKARARRALSAVVAARTLAEAVAASAKRRGPAAEIVRAAAEEADASADAVLHAGGEGLKERVVSRLARIEAAAGRSITRGTGLLATIGSTAPFVGLFGTVWGIMNAFIGISEAQTINLAIVAPGIAEALLATAIGLVAAIPAVVIYNVFARSITGYRARLADVSAAVLRLVSRDLDYRHVPPDGARLVPQAAE